MGFARLRFAIACFIPLAVITVTGMQILHDYHDTLDRQETAMRDMTHVVNLQISETIRYSNAVLKEMERMVGSEANLSRFSDPSLDLMGALCNTLNGCVVLTVIDTSGNVVARSTKDRTQGINVSDRAYFKSAINKGGLFIAPAVSTRLPGHPILFAISKPVLNASGKVVAVVSAHLTTDHFTAFYGLMGFNLNPAVTIYKTNGSIVARHPDMEKHVGKTNINSNLFMTYLPKAPAGVFRTHGNLDGKERIGAYRLVPEWNLVIFCGTQVDTAMAAWKKRSLGTVAAGTLGLLLISVIFVWGYRALMRQRGLIAQNSELDRLSHSDPLTGIANRRTFDIALAQAWEAYVRTGKDFSLLLIDADNFKNFNDRYGHPDGDRCLKTLAAALDRSLFIKEGLVARYGGEEFAAILHCTKEDALKIAECMRQAVQNLRIPHDASTAATVVTVSIGVATASASDVRTADGLLACADAALYQAKSAGRNCVASEMQAVMSQPAAVS
jgi:diguanylate cyclase (GGDEF)-like protein